MERSLFQTKRKVHRTGRRESGKHHISGNLVWVPHIAKGEESGMGLEKERSGVRIL